MNESGNIIISHTTALSFWLSPLPWMFDYVYLSKEPLMNRTHAFVKNMPETLRSDIMAFSNAVRTSNAARASSGEERRMFHDALGREYLNGWAFRYSSFGDNASASASINSDKGNRDGRQGVSRDAFRDGSRGASGACVHLLGAKTYSVGSSSVVGHTCRYKFPPRSFVKIASGPYEGIYVARPELSLVQSAGMLSTGQFLLAAYQLCGAGALGCGSHGLGRGSCGGGTLDVNPSEVGKPYGKKRLADGTVKFDSTTSKQKIETFLSRAKAIYGAPRVRGLLRYVADNSWSPRESMLAIHLVLPYALGGYGLPLPEMNGKVALSHIEKRTSQSGNLYIDLFWPDKMFGVEYDSDQFHLSSQKAKRDSNRLTVLARAGVEKVGFTSGQFDDLVEFDKIARVVAEHLGKRVNPRRTDFWKTMPALRAELMAPIPGNIWRW